MKELEKHQPEKVAVVAEQRKQKIVSTLERQRGHTIYEMHIETRIVRVAEMEEGADFEMNTNPRDARVVHNPGIIHRKVKVREGCIYVSALNNKNADKKFIKKLIEVGYIKKAPGEALLKLQKHMK